MKKNTPLDYAEFLLSHSRSRCELHIYANGVREKLASGHLKPFVTHLREAESQVARGNEVIRLERPSSFQKKNKVTWFTKGTLERFVRFVSTPEVLERVKSIDDEVLQLEHVRIAFSKTSVQSEDTYYSNDTTGSGVCQTRGVMASQNRRLVGDSGVESSKIELLKAMDVRILALKQEQRDAFLRAIAAGFDHSNMADLLDFSEHFGAERLREACIQFIRLFRGWNVAQEVAGVELASADGSSSDSDMSLESCADVQMSAELGEHHLVSVEEELMKAASHVVSDRAGKLDMKISSNFLGRKSSTRTRSRWGPPERLQIRQVDPELQDPKFSKRDERNQSGKYNHQDDMRGFGTSQAREKSHSTTGLKYPVKVSSLIDNQVLVQSVENGSEEMPEVEGNIRPHMFNSGLHKMAQPVDTRKSNDDIGMLVTSAKERSVDFLESHPSKYGLTDGVIHSSEKSPSDSLPPAVDTCSVLDETPEVGKNYSMKSSVGENTAENSPMNKKTNLKSSNNLQSGVCEGRELKDNQGDAVNISTRRLSVQAAISLFESKKSTVEEPPMRKTSRQVSQKSLVQNSSASEKSMLFKWSGVGGINEDIDNKQSNFAEVVQSQGDVVVSENTAQPVKVVTEQKSQNIIISPQTAMVLSSNSRRQLGLGEISVEPPLLEKIPLQYVQSIEGISLNLPVDLGSKQSDQQLWSSASPKSYINNPRASNILSSKALPDDKLKSEMNNVAPETGYQDRNRGLLGRQEQLQTQLMKDFKEPTMEGSLNTSGRQTKQFTHHNDANLIVSSAEYSKIDRYNHKTGKTRPIERALNSQEVLEAGAKSSLVLHDTSVDLYMQALVMMIDNHHQNSLRAGLEEPLMEHQGRLYDRYWQLRNARQMGENPVKRAERVAKLKSLQEILDRRKTEMETGVLKHSRSNHLVRGQEHSGAIQNVMSNIDSASRELGEDTVVGQQDELVLALSNSQSMSKTKVHPVRQVTSQAQMDGFASPCLLTAFPVHSSRGFPQGESGTAALLNNNQQKKVTCNDNMSVNSQMHRAFTVDTTGNLSKSIPLLTELSGNPPIEIRKHPHHLWVNSAAFPSAENRSEMNALSLPGLHSDSSQGREDLESPTYLDTASFSLPQNPTLDLPKDSLCFSLADAYLRKKPEAFKYYSGSFNKQAHLISNGMSLKASNESSTLQDLSSINTDNSMCEPDKLPDSTLTTLVPLNMETAEHFSSDALSSEKDSDVVDEEISAKIHGDRMGLSLEPSKEVRMLNTSEQSLEIIHISSVNSPSLPNKCNTCNNSDTTPSFVNSLEKASEVTRGIFSPELSPSPYSPSGSPASWTYLKTKVSSEHERFSIVSHSTKEPVRGFRRLLQFGRKNRTSELTSSDGISVSTTPERYDETEEFRESMGRSPSGLLQRVKPQQKGRHGLPFPGTNHSIQSSISMPALSLKQQEDGFPEVLSSKASRSFFSLSSFRSKGCEGKSR